MIREAWEAYEPFREQFTSLAPDKYPPEYIDSCVMIGSWRCWGTDEAAILFELKKYPSGITEVYGWAAAGELNAIKELIYAVEIWGRANGARAAEIESRPGWSKALASEGYEITQVCIRKVLA